MIKRRISITALMLLLVLNAFAALDKVSLDSDATSWRLKPQDEVSDAKEMLSAGYDVSGWIPAVVPGAVFTSFVEAGLEEDPNYGDNIYKVDRKKYDRNFWYRTEFRTEEMPEGKHQWICFDGVNRKADIYLNGTLLCKLDGFMERGMFDVANSLKRDGTENVLAVLTYWPTNPVPNYASPTYISSAGWDWMPYVPSLLEGITDNVFFATSGDVLIIDPWIRTKVPSKDKGIITVSAELKNNSESDQTGILRGVITPGGIVFEKRLEIPPGKQRNFILTSEEFPQLSIDNPALWWPNGYGKPELYSCELSYVIDGQESDVKKIVFGIKEYAYDWSAGGVFHLSVNGEPVYCKGGNWGMSEYLLRCRDSEYDLKVRLHKEMHYNMIRNWIGSTTDDEFYQACDKYGIMVFDDFWLNSHPNLPDDVFAFNKNAVEKIKRLRNHPSIALWCGDNEGIPQRPLDGWLREDVSTYDGGDRWYQSISREYGFSGSGPWTNASPVWYFSEYPLGFGEQKLDGWGFRSEIGTAVFPNYDSFCKFMPEEHLWPPMNEMWDKHFFGNSSFNSRPDRYFATVGYNYGESANAEEFCTKSQLLNIEVNKAMYEGWQHHLWDDASGILVWMSQSAYPSMVWQTYDYYYDLNGAYWGTRKACESVHIQWSYADNSIKAVNASLTDFDEVKVAAKVYDMHGKEVKDYSKSASGPLPANGAVELMKLDFPEDSNIARGCEVIASTSEVRKDYLSSSAVTDGNTGSCWSAGDGGKQWIYVDLGSPKEFSSIVLWWESKISKKYEISVSNDAESWKGIFASNQESKPIDEIKVNPVTARYVKIRNVESVQPGRGMALYEIELYSSKKVKSDLSPVHFIRLEMTGGNGGLLSDNFYWRSNRPGDYRALNDLPPVKLGISYEERKEGGKTIINATVTNRSKTPAFAVRLMLVDEASGQQILPAIMDDDYFTLFSRESKSVRIEADTESFKGKSYKVIAKPYNNVKK